MRATTATKDYITTICGEPLLITLIPIQLSPQQRRTPIGTLLRGKCPVVHLSQDLRSAVALGTYEVAIEARSMRE